MHPRMILFQNASIGTTFDPLNGQVEDKDHDTNFAYGFAVSSYLGDLELNLFFYCWIYYICIAWITLIRIENIRSPCTNDLLCVPTNIWSVLHTLPALTDVWEMTGHGQLFRLISRLMSMFRFLSDAADLTGKTEPDQGHTII